MLPILVSVGPIVLYTYSLFVFVAVFFGLFVIWKRGNELHFEPKELFDAAFSVFFWIFIGARVGYVATHVGDFGLKVFDWINVFGRPGWYYPAGIIGGWWAIGKIAKKAKWDCYQLADLIVLGLVLAEAILALGALFAGVGYGAPTQSFLGMKFAGVYDRRYPVQIWEGIGFGATFAYLWWVEGVYRTFSWYKRNRSQAQTGYIFSVYLIAWGGVKLIAQLFRAPELVVGPGIRLDLIVPGIVMVAGGYQLLKRAGVLPNNLLHSVLDYFGLAK